MRGDSLRDFYAKTLAVVGLGLLAGAGAIVDYWPVNGEWPSVPAVAALRADRPVPVPQLTADIEIPAPQIIRASQRTTPRPAPASFGTTFRAVRFVEPVTTPQPEAAPTPELDLSGIGIDAAAPAAMLAMTAINLDLEPPVDVAEPMGSGGASSSRSFVARAVGALNAIKKTRSSLKDAVRGVAGTFRKVSPFWDTTAATSMFR